MTKIYSLYGKDERKIDNLKRKIQGYEKMKIDLLRLNRKLNKENQQLRSYSKKLECLIENVYLGVNLNNEQEFLLDKIMLGSDK